MYISLAGSPAGIQQKTEFREEGWAAFGRCLLVSILHSAKFHWRFTAGFQQDSSSIPAIIPTTALIYTHYTPPYTHNTPNTQHA
jgi:hypothetical protein